MKKRRSDYVWLGLLIFHIDIWIYIHFRYHVQYTLSMHTIFLSSRSIGNSIDLIWTLNHTYNIICTVHTHTPHTPHFTAKVLSRRIPYATQTIYRTRYEAQAEKWLEIVFIFFRFLRPGAERTSESERKDEREREKREPEVVRAGQGPCIRSPILAEDRYKIRIL